MIHLIFIPIIFVAAIIKIVSKRTNMKIFNIICNIVIILASILFAYFFAAYLGFDIIEIIYNLLISK